jgi:hypothetical protein
VQLLNKTIPREEHNCGLIAKRPLNRPDDCVVAALFVMYEVVFARVAAIANIDYGVVFETAASPVNLLFLRQRGESFSTQQEQK